MSDNSHPQTIAEQIAERRSQALTPEPHEPAPIPTNFRERVELVEQATAQLADLSIASADSDEQLILQLANAVGGVPPHDQGKGQLVITSHEAKAAVNAALAQAANLKRQADALAKRRDEILAVFKEALGDDEELVIDGAILATYKRSTSRVLNQAHIKKIFPDTPENSEAWMDQDKRTFLLK